MTPILGQDVPLFLKWLHANKGRDESAQSE